MFPNSCNIKAGLAETNFGKEGPIVVPYFAINRSKVTLTNEPASSISFSFAILKNLVRTPKIIAYSIGNRAITPFPRLNFTIPIYSEITTKHSAIKCNFIFFIFFLLKYYFK